MESLASKFKTALQFCLKNAKYGEKSVLANTAGVAVSVLLNLEKGRRGSSEETRRKIAAALGYQYDRFLELGEKVLAGEEISPYDRLLPKPEPDIELIPAAAVHLIEKIAFISKYSAAKLNYIEPLVSVIYDEIKLGQDEKEDKISL
ncbi:MAG: hypothetical protein LBJ14_01255 [Desulfarculales bacterium]|jgi:transcriptional regulator with XRE-family HTH domain|nr:hypothetical protein [Desulfarculales bacterium]